MDPRKEPWTPSPEMRDRMAKTTISPKELKEVVIECYRYLMKKIDFENMSISSQFKQTCKDAEHPTKEEIIEVIVRLNKLVRPFISANIIRQTQLSLEPFIIGCWDGPESTEVQVSVESDITEAKTTGVVFARKMGFSSASINKIVTTISELARNIINYADGGTIRLTRCSTRPLAMEIVAKDHGPGIENIDSILSNNYVSRTGMGKGLIGCKRLMDKFDIETSSAGTYVRVVKYLD